MKTRTPFRSKKLIIKNLRFRENECENHVGDSADFKNMLAS